MTRQHPYRKQALLVHTPTPLPAESRVRVNGRPGYLAVQWATTPEPSDRSRPPVLASCVGLAVVLLMLLSWNPSDPRSFVLWLVGLAGWTFGAVHVLGAEAGALESEATSPGSRGTVLVGDG